MRRSQSKTILTMIPAFLALSLGLGACRKAEQATSTTTTAESVAVPTAAAPAASVRVTDVQLGKALGPDKRVQTPMDSFAPRDTIFASVSTDGSGAGSTLHVKWTFQDGQTVKEDSRTISPTGPAVTEFSIQKPDGWPKGDYKIEVSVDGQVVSTKSFRVA